MPGDLIGRMPHEIAGVELAPEVEFDIRTQSVVAQDAARLFLPLRDTGELERAVPLRTLAVMRNRSSSSLPFQAFHTFGLVPRMSATVSR